LFFLAVVDKNRLSLSEFSFISVHGSSRAQMSASM